jgi:hypothetical protein
LAKKLAHPKFRWHVTPEEQAQIRDLTLKGKLQVEISRILGIDGPTIKKWQVKMGLSIARPYRRAADKAHVPKTPDENIQRFTEAVRNREDYIIRLARKHGVAICLAKRIAHEILGTRRFRGGVAKPPLSSDFPQKESNDARV